MSRRPRVKQTYRIPPELLGQLADHARARKVSQVAIVEAALASFLSPDGADRLEAALSRRLDRSNRSLERLEWQLELATEALSLFIRFWLTSNPPLPDTARAAAQAMGRERWEGFVESLNRRMELGPKLSSELSRESETGTVQAEKDDD